MCAQEEREKAEASELEKRKADQIMGGIQSANLTGRFAAATFGAYECEIQDQRDAVDACRSFVGQLQTTNGSGLFLIGTPGTGKTHLAAAMCHAAIAQLGMTARLLTARELIRSLRATWRRGADRSEDQVIDELGGLGLLALDEVGVTFGADAELVQLFDVLDLRYRRRKPTVVVSNLPMGQIKASLGGRLFDRLREGAVVVPCDWPSHRGKRANAGAPDPVGTRAIR